MTFVKDLEDLKDLCRICLISSSNMIPLDNNLDDKSEHGPLILDALEDILTVKLENDTNYPMKVCQICRGSLRISYDLKIIFNKSQNILKKYVSSLQQIESVDSSYENMLAVVSDKTDDLSNDINGIENDDVNEEENDIKSPDIPNKKVKLFVNSENSNNVKVKWLEGNKFIMETDKKTSLYKCWYCQKEFTSKSHCSSHMSACNDNVCEYCKKKFQSERSLRLHLKVVHGTILPSEIKCKLCDKTFKNYNARSYHRITKHSIDGKKHTCEICGKAFHFKNSLSQHLESHSRDVSRVVCPICGKSFHYRGGLFYHMKIHRNERNYVCTYCNSKFLNMTSLKRHTRMHTGERPYKCSFCPKSFCSRSEVKAHERRHTGQKPHECKYCGKQFITPYNRKLHMSSHTGSEPCDICGKSYLTVEVLKYHKELKHNIKEQNNEDAMV